MATLRVCPNCGNEIAVDATVCFRCGRSVALGVFSAGAKAVHDTARAFLGIGILNIIAGGIGIGVGWFIGVFAIIVGIIEIINAYIYWPTPPRSTSRPVYVVILEIIVFFCGTFWSIIAGFANRKRLNSTEVKNYFLALKSGQPVVTEDSFILADARAAGLIAVSNQKKCPGCGNSINIEAKICQYCQQSFSEADIETAKNQNQAFVAQNQAERVETDQRKRGKSLRTAGIILAVIGALILILAVLIQATSPTSANTEQGFLSVILLCPTPLILLGGGLFAWGTSSLHKLINVQATHNIS